MTQFNRSLRTLVYNWIAGVRPFSMTANSMAAPKKQTGAPSAGARQGIQVETDPSKLTKFLCGGNILKEGSDPLLKQDSEYPDWLWSLDLEPNKQQFESLDKNSFKYWRKVRVNFKKRKNLESRLRYN